MMYDGYGWGGMGFGGVGMLLFWGLIVVVAVLLARSFIGKLSGAQGSAGAKAALDILRERGWTELHEQPTKRTPWEP